MLETAPLIKEKVSFLSPRKNVILLLAPTNPHREFAVYLLQILHDSCEPLIFCLNVGDHGPALFQFVLHLQDLPQIVSFLGGRLLQKRFLPSLPILSNLPVDGEGLPKGLQSI